MPIQTTYPGLYVQEVSSGVHPIAGVSTSDTAFIDIFKEGPVGVATRVTGLDDFTRRFGPIDASIPAGYAVLQYFVNGGSTAWIVRVTSDSAKASSLVLQDSTPADVLTVSAVDEGTWGDSVQVAVVAGSSSSTFTLVVRRLGTVGGVVGAKAAVGVATAALITAGSVSVNRVEEAAPPPQRPAATRPG